jgi:hypothetical protein
VLLKSLLLAVMVFSASRGASALPQDKVGKIAEPANEAYEAGAKNQKDRGSNPLLNEEATKKDPIKGEAPPVRNHFEFKVPPMAGFQQIAGMKTMKDMLKRLITADVPVMFQTMMMVENGAATGYIGSMNTVGSLLSNTIQTSQLQMDLFDAEEAGGKKKAYVLEAYGNMVSESENKDSWPAALWWASGDRIEGTPKPINTVKDNTESTGSSETTLKEAEKELPAEGGAKKELLLSELLFPPGAYSPEAGFFAGDLQEGMLNWVGDLKIVTQQTGEHSSVVKPEFVEAKKFESASSSSSGSGGSEGEPGSVYDLLVKETTLEVWKHLHLIMKQYCEFKQRNDNYTKEMFEKKRPSSAIKDEDWKKIHSLDVKPSINLVDQLFKLFLGRRNVSEIRCDSFRGDENTLPDKGEPTSSSGTIFDSCDENPKQCLRNVVLYRITRFIAISQVNYFYRWMWEQIYVRTKDEAEQEYLTDLFCTNVQLGWPCDPGTEFSVRIDTNRVAWIEFSNKLSKFAQGQGGSAIFRPSSDSSTIGAAGSVAMGSGASGVGGN